MRPGVLGDRAKTTHIYAIRSLYRGTTNGQKDAERFGNYTEISATLDELQKQLA